MIQLKKFHTNEELTINFRPTTVVYYQLSFNFDSGDMARYEYWRKTSDAVVVKQLGCTLLIAMKDVSGAGFLRRYALISGESRKNVVTAYNTFRATFINLPEYEGE
ncbi:unnamed protein product [Mesocestoides corti]|uniref:Phage protein n=1 Tax=Mesocestoides corti TaxID=53468 RepID=A0A0R3UFC8_MESCO|nr:unnamed protein product [Mesocestoides corti]